MLLVTPFFSVAFKYAGISRSEPFMGANFVNSA